MAEMFMNRRRVLTGLTSLMLAPSIVRASSLMPIRPEFIVWYDYEYEPPLFTSSLTPLKVTRRVLDNTLGLWRGAGTTRFLHDAEVERLRNWNQKHQGSFLVATTCLAPEHLAYGQHGLAEPCYDASPLRRAVLSFNGGETSFGEEENG